MSTATTTLRQEHEAILKMLEAAEEVVHQLKRRAAVSPRTLSGLLEFLRLFADRCHHAKEEEFLLPLLEQKGLPSAGGPLGVMLLEHDQGRGFIRQMGAASEAYSRGEEGAGERWLRAASGYIQLLRTHIMKENNILFPIADRLLSPAEQQTLSDAFERIENEKLGPGTHELLHALMVRLRAEIFSGTKSVA